MQPQSRRDFLAAAGLAGIAALPIASIASIATAAESQSNRSEKSEKSKKTEKPMIPTQPANNSPAGQQKPHSKPHADQDKIGYSIGCFTRPWAAHEYPVALDAIAEAGFEYVGLMTHKGGQVLSAATSIDEAHKIGEQIKKRGLKTSTVYGGDIEANKGLPAAIAAMRRLIDNCVAVGASSVLMGGTIDAKLYDDYYKAIAENCDYAESKKLTIVIKPHGGQNSTGAECRKCVERVNHRNFRLWYDAGNIYYYSDGKLSPVDDAATVDGLVTGMCVKDYLFAKEATPSQKATPKSVDVTPGTGAVDFPAVMRVLHKGGFTHGPLVIETLAAKTALPDILAEAKKGRLFVEQLVRGLEPGSQEHKGQL